MGIVDELVVCASGDFGRLAEKFLSFNCEVIFDLHISGFRKLALYILEC